MYRTLVGAMMAGSLVLMTGCAGFKSNSLPLVSGDQIKSAAPAKIKVFSRWSMQAKSDSKMMNNPQVMAAVGAIQKKNFEDAVKQADCCVLVEGPTEADVVVDGKFINENNPAAVFPAFLTGFSLFTIPSWATSNVHLQVTANRGGKSTSYDLRDSMKMFTWLPMLFAMPFVDSPNPIKAEKEITENAYRNLVLKMQTDGVLK